MVSRKKDTYWHEVAHLCLQAGQKPATVAKVIKSIFPKTDVNGRHIGAYKRRLIEDGVIDKDIPTVGGQNELIQLGNDLVSKEDMFIYNCSVGSIKRSLKCFEYKLTAEAKDIDNEVETWIEAIKTK